MTHFTQKNGNVSAKNLYVNIYSSFILNHQSLETTEISINRWDIYQVWISIQ